MTALPHFPLPDDTTGTYGALIPIDEDEEEEADRTAPAPPPVALPPRQFVLALPAWMVLQLEANPRPPFGAPAQHTRSLAAPVVRPQLQTPPAWTVDTSRFSRADFAAAGHGRRNALVVLASVVLGCALVAVTGLPGGSVDSDAKGAAAASDLPVGIALHAPRTLDKSVRTRDRITGHASNTPTVSIDSLAHARHHHHR